MGVLGTWFGLIIFGGTKNPQLKAEKIMRGIRH